MKALHFLLFAHIMCKLHNTANLSMCNLRELMNDKH